ncbi:SMP-30/gluconolactonase/LRE family protein [Undibacterium sp. CY18W]|uniref:SMP-30/gluconolactonase/LRE family protein n=2 Tax=Undibacterium hunanense TaxID=2762292 RepID=A0ABR6ZT50_9BURK|nr:SMP-30/gluconolactonase/LRE family protein [Undibacterium hunanense]
MVRRMILDQSHCIWEVATHLGEGPVWHAGEKALYFVDIKSRKIHRCAEDGAARQSWDAPDQIGFILPIQGENGNFICGLPGKLVRFSSSTGSFTTMLEVETAQPGNRLNDGYIDSQGCLWFGSMDDGEKAPSGSLYRLNTLTDLQAKDHDYIITNGPCMSPDGKVFYHTDTLRKKIYAFDVTPDGNLSGKRVFADITNGGHPDGTVVDAEGYLWVAIFAGNRVERYSPAGEIVQVISFPCSNITKVCFGGDDLRTVFVTTAWKGMSAERREQQPLAGGLFSFRVDVPGLPQYQFSEHAS